MTKTTTVITLIAFLFLTASCGGGSPGPGANLSVASTTPPASKEPSTITMRPPCADGSPYTLIVRNPESMNAAVLDKMACQFFRNYPKIVARINPKAQLTVRFHFEEAPPHIASVSNGIVTYSIPYMTTHPADIDIVTHEIVHVAQTGLDLPGWIIEGTADFLREEYGTYNQDAAWKIVNRYEPSQHYTDGYGTAASFFKWIDANYRSGMPPVVEALHAAASGKYDPAIWVRMTGHDVDTLWYHYSGKTVPKPPAPDRVELK